MATKHIIGPGIGFSPGSVKFIVTRGLAIQAAASTVATWTLKSRSRGWTLINRDRDWELKSRSRAWTLDGSDR